MPIPAPLTDAIRAALVSLAQFSSGHLYHPLLQGSKSNGVCWDRIFCPTLLCGSLTMDDGMSIPFSFFRGAADLYTIKVMITRLRGLNHFADAVDLFPNQDFLRGVLSLDGATPVSLGQLAALYEFTRMIQRLEKVIVYRIPADRWTRLLLTCSVASPLTHRHHQFVGVA